MIRMQIKEAKSYEGEGTWHTVRKNDKRKMEGGDGRMRVACDKNNDKRKQSKMK